MKSTFVYFLKYYLFWILFMLGFKIFFVLYNIDTYSALDFTDLYGIFLHGFKMDLSAAAYFTLVPALLFTFGFFAKNKITPFIIRYYTLFVLILLIILAIVDAGLYVEWGSRINAQFLTYLKDVGGMYASLNWWQLILLPISWFALVYFIYKRFKKHFALEKMSNLQIKLWHAIPLLLLSAALIIPIRGGLDRSPLNHSSVYFSTNLNANQAAYNYFWNFMYSVLKSKDKAVAVNYMDSQEAKRVLLAADDKYPAKPMIQLNGKACNVVFVMLEGISNKTIERLGGMRNVCVNLDKACDEGIAFSNFFATGARSDKGMISLVGGRPSDMNRRTALAFPNKLTKLDYLPRYFAKQGYDMSFYYGGDVNFYNTRAVMIESGMKDIISKSNFPTELGLMQKWGVPDEYLYAKVFEDMKNRPQPFFSMVYNISSHPPYDIPKHFNKFSRKTDEGTYLNSVAYADSCLGVFIDSLKASEMWNNTLVVISSDHTSRLPGLSDNNSPERYRIPLILIGGVVKQKKELNRTFANANDLSVTLVKQMGWEHKDDLLSKDFSNGNGYAFYFTDSGWAYCSEKYAWYQDVNTKQRITFYNELKDDSLQVEHFAKAYVQYLHEEHLND